MKKSKRFLYLSLILLCFLMSYVAGYAYARIHLKSDNIRRIDDTASENPVLDSSISVAGTTDESIVKKDTQYIVQSYQKEAKNGKQSEMSEQIETLPLELIGMTRDDLVDYYSAYQNKEDIENGLTNIQVVSFTGDTLIVRKSFEPVQTVYHYWMVEQENHLIVLKADKETVYINTAIRVDTLPQEEQDKLKDGIPIESIHELYSYLETYTS